MANAENQHLNTNLNADKTTDVTRTQNREAVAASHEDAAPMGNASEDTGARPSNDNKGNQNASNPHTNETGSHREGQYPRNGENHSLRDEQGAQKAQQYTREAKDESQGLIGKPGDKPE